jgi:uncharacterized hydrophobic protein (TIGR00341 family)
MPYKTLEIVAPATHRKAIENIALETAATLVKCHKGSKKENDVFIFLTPRNQLQHFMDRLQQLFKKDEPWQLLVHPIDTVLPLPAEAESDTEKQAKKITDFTLSREELYTEVSKGADIDSHFLLLLILSITVTAVGLIEDNVAAVIGGMIISPLLGPHLAFALGASLGDRNLMIRSLKANTLWFTITFIVSIALGMFFTLPESHELISRTHVNIGGIVLALASGAAAVLSLTRGLSSALVGVMVAVALLPPAVTLGLMTGAERYSEAYGTGLLLAVNIVCVNLAAQVVLRTKGVKPRTWYKKKKAEQSQFMNLLV